MRRSTTSGVSTMMLPSLPADALAGAAAGEVAAGEVAAAGPAGASAPASPPAFSAALAAASAFNFFLSPPNWAEAGVARQAATSASATSRPTEKDPLFAIDIFPPGRSKPGDR